MSHSLKNFWDPLFLYRKIMFGLFFFSGHFWHDFCFFFFPRKSLPSLTHSVEKRVFFFFPAAEKKKRVFHTLTRFLPKNPKKQTIPGKKKKRYLWLTPCSILQILFKGISFVKLNPRYFFEQNVRFSQISFKGFSF